MKILHLVAGDLSGGAARGAYWLHLAQRNLGIDSRILTDTYVNVSDDSIVSLARTPFKRVKLALLRRIENFLLSAYRKRKPWIFSLGNLGYDFTKHPSYKAADVIHLHWVNGLVAIRTLKKIKKPVIWTLRDMWPLTGGCHYVMECEGYKVGCGSCPQLGSQMKQDLSRFVSAQKRSSLPKQLHIVGISQWLSEKASESHIFKGYPVQTISNNVDTQTFTPITPEVARNVLGLPSDKKIILVGAQKTTDFYKGFALFINALQYLHKESLHVVTFGTHPGSTIDDLGIKHTSLHFLTDTISLRLVYSAADVFVAPSTMEAFGKTLAEAMACATPVVCFDATGPKDIVTHKVTGFKANPFDPAHLAEGIKWVLEQPESVHNELRKNARQHAIENFDSHIIANQYKTLYQQILMAETD